MRQSARRFFLLMITTHAACGSGAVGGTNGVADTENDGVELTQGLTPLADTYVVSGTSLLYVEYNYGATLDRDQVAPINDWAMFTGAKRWTIDPPAEYRPPGIGPREGHNRITSVAFGAGLTALLPLIPLQQLLDLFDVARGDLFRFERVPDQRRRAASEHVIDHRPELRASDLFAGHAGAVQELPAEGRVADETLHLEAGEDGRDRLASEPGMLELVMHVRDRDDAAPPDRVHDLELSFSELLKLSGHIGA